mmetsp:Transcript_8441/g.13020  ORF Transcript_8441/g.13020 Transcript_8441/m.13020 type:complete len:740 (+) Transcript_8441:72-2291(+)
MMLLKSQNAVYALLIMLVKTSGGHSSFRCNPAFWRIRGGVDTAPQSTTINRQYEGSMNSHLSLDEKVQRAMEKLGLADTAEGDDECEGGKCELKANEATTQTSLPKENTKSNTPEGPHAMAERLSKEMSVTKDLAMAALGATGEVQSDKERRLNESAARVLIQQELDLISGISEDRDDVKQLVDEGHEVFLARRALAFADENMDDARAILEADRIDAAEEERRGEQAKLDSQKEGSQSKEDSIAPETPALKTIDVDSGFDPTSGSLPSRGGETPKETPPTESLPPPAAKSDVVFEATTAQIQEIVLESPVPVLLDCYAPWCGPCKALTPALEDMAIKAGGSFRLVKVNTDNERAVSSALEVTALPTIFAVRDGKILNNFQGMPKSEEMMRNFMMGLLMPGANFNPPVNSEQTKKFEELSVKLAKTAGASSFSFSARERLQSRIAKHLDDLVEAHDGDMAGAEESAKVVRSLLSNVIRDPYNMKFRTVNLQNKKIAAAVNAFVPCISMLKNVGFCMGEDGSQLVIGKDKKVVNVSSLTVARDCIDKWIDKNRYNVAVANRKRKDEAARSKLATEASFESTETEEELVDPDAVNIKVRLEGKKKVHELEMRADEPLSKVVEKVFDGSVDGNYQLICAAKKLIVKSDDDTNLSKSLRSLGMTPAAALVIKMETNQSKESAANSLKERVAAKKNLKRGSHTMQSIGVYAKDDNAKGEVIDGGGGVLYEQDVTDDEEEGEENKD